MTSAEGERARPRIGLEWVDEPVPCARLVTVDGDQVGTVVCVHAKDMKGPWCWAAAPHGHCQTIDDDLWKTLGHRTGFRRHQGLTLGMGTAPIRVSTPERRDR